MERPRPMGCRITVSSCSMTIAQETRWLYSPGAVGLSTPKASVLSHSLAIKCKLKPLVHIFGVPLPCVAEEGGVLRTGELQPSCLDPSPACSLGHRKDLLLGDHVPLWVLHVLGDG